MQKINIKDIFIPCITLFLICLIVTACLVGVNGITKDRIKEQEEIKKSDSCRLVLNKAEKFDEVSDGNGTYYIATDNNGELVGYSFITITKGYGGDISVMTGVDTEKNVTGVVILSQNETPGLGANTEKEDFTNQYKAKAPDTGFDVVKTVPKDGEIKAVTGATISSKAVTKAVNEALARFENISSNEGVR